MSEPSPASMPSLDERVALIRSSGRCSLCEGSGRFMGVCQSCRGEGTADAETDVTLSNVERALGIRE